MTTDPIPEDQPMLAGSPAERAVPHDRRVMDHKTQPKKKTQGPIPARQGNGYYADHQTGDRLRSVTTIIGGGVPKPALVYWAAGCSTDAAIDLLPTLVAASRFPDQMAAHSRWIRQAHERTRDERAEVGSAVHTIIESRLLGTPLPKAVEVSGQEWALDGPELAPYIENFHRFEDDWSPTWTASEMVVANPTLGYAGTLDYLIAGDGLIGDALRAAGHDVDPAGDIMGDTKTGGVWDRVLSSGHVHGVYPEAGLQMSAYRHAEVCWLRSGERVPMPAAAPVGVVLHLRPEGYRLYPALCGEREFTYFRHAQMVDEWSSRISSAAKSTKDKVIGPALSLSVAAPQQGVA